MKVVDFKKYIALYSLEDYLFNVVGPQVKKRGYMTFDEFYRIGMWKSARQKPNYVKNMDSVELITRDAFLISDERLKMEKLCSLKGVAIPTASAILTIPFPDKYAVIDIRCIEMLQELEYSVHKTITISNWLKYLNVMRTLARDNEVSPREIDKALFAMHREWLDGQNYKNLYEKI